MAKITTFSTLKTALGSFVDRDDMDAVGGTWDILIGLCEAEIYRDLRIRFMESAFSVTIASGVAALPADFLELKHVYVDGSPTQGLDPKSAAWIYANYPTRAAEAKPVFFAQDADNLIFGPYPDSAYVIKGTYYALPTALGTGNETNWLTTNAPDLLLNGSLLASVGYLGEDERSPGWQRNYTDAFNRIMEADERERWPAQMPLRMVPG